MATQPAAKTKQTTISMKQLAADLAGSHEMPKKQAEAMLGDLAGNDCRCRSLPGRLIDQHEPACLRN